MRIGLLLLFIQFLILVLLLILLLPGFESCWCRGRGPWLPKPPVLDGRAGVCKIGSHKRYLYWIRVAPAWGQGDAESPASASSKHER